MPVHNCCWKVVHRGYGVEPHVGVQGVPAELTVACFPALPVFLPCLDQRLGLSRGALPGQKTNLVRRPKSLYLSVTILVT